MNAAQTVDGLPTDDDRRERRRRRTLVVAGIGATLVIAGLLVVFAKSNPKLNPVAAPTTTTTSAPSGGYTANVSAAGTALTGLLTLATGWDATSAGIQKDEGTVSASETSALAALQAARAAHRAKPQDCPGVLASTAQVQTATASVATLAGSISARATQVLDALAQSQAQVDQLTADIAAAAANATPAQTVALQSLQLSTTSLGIRRTAFTQTMTSYRDKADASVANAQTLSGQAATLAAGCPH